MAVGHEHAVVLPSHPVRGGHRPSGGTDGSVSRQRLDAIDGRAEGDVATQVELIGEEVEVLQHLIAVGEERPVLGHGEALVAGHLTGGDQVERVVVVIPVPADGVGLLEAVDLMARIEHGLEGGKARRAGSNDAVASHGVS